MPVGCECLANGTLDRPEKAWTPIRSHRCGLGMPVGCECLANGTLDRPEEAMDLAFG